MKLPEGIYKSLLNNLSEGVYIVDTGRRITYWNSGAEKISGFPAAAVIGKRCGPKTLKHIDAKGAVLCRGACPLEKTLTDGLPRSAEVYLHHKDGHQIPVILRTKALFDEKKRIIGAAQIFTDNSSTIEAIRKIEKLEKIAYIDPLTRAANRRYTEISLDARLNEMKRYRWPFAVIFADIDNLKRVNDTYGHDIGDRVLTTVVQTFLKNIRSFDLVGRWGGEEFVIILTNIHEVELLHTITQRLRVLIQNSSVRAGAKTIHATVSCGATLAREKDTRNALIKRADSLMYRAKTSGRNTVCVDNK